MVILLKLFRWSNIELTLYPNQNPILNACRIKPEMVKRQWLTAVSRAEPHSFGVLYNSIYRQISNTCTISYHPDWWSIWMENIIEIFRLISFRFWLYRMYSLIIFLFERSWRKEIIMGQSNGSARITTAIIISYEKMLPALHRSHHNEEKHQFLRCEFGENQFCFNPPYYWKFNPLLCILKLKIIVSIENWDLVASHCFWEHSPGESRHKKACTIEKHGFPRVLALETMVSFQYYWSFYNFYSTKRDPMLKKCEWFPLSSFEGF